MIFVLWFSSYSIQVFSIPFSQNLTIITNVNSKGTIQESSLFQIVTYTRPQAKKKELSRAFSLLRCYIYVYLLCTYTQRLRNGVFIRIMLHPIYKRCGADGATNGDDDDGSGTRNKSDNEVCFCHRLYLEKKCKSIIICTPIINNYMNLFVSLFQCAYVDLYITILVSKKVGTNTQFQRQKLILGRKVFYREDTKLSAGVEVEGKWREKERKRPPSK